MRQSTSKKRDCARTLIRARVHWVRRLPSRALLISVGPGFETLVPARLPIPVIPAVIAKFGSILELRLGDVGYVSAARGVIIDGSPRQRIMAVAEAHESS